MSDKETQRSIIDTILGLVGLPPSPTPSEWASFFRRLFKVSLVAAVVSAVVLFIAIRLFGFRIVGGQYYLGANEPGHSVLVIVDSTSGWQISGIKVSKGDRFRLEPSGRIHLAANQLYNLAQATKPLIIMGTQGRRTWPQNILKRYPPPKLDESNIFYRDWITPAGEDIPSDMLDSCKIRTDLRWGILLCTILPNPSPSQSDPLHVMADAGIKPSDLIPVPSPIEIEAPKDGWLAFIVNEAVISPFSPSADSQEFYKALTIMKGELSNDSRHQLYEPSIPLIFFSDNAGSFRVVVSRAS